MEKLVSVIIPCYNQARFVSSAIDSIVAQTYSNHEIIVVNDGSTDDTIGVVQSSRNVRLINQPNQGVSVARNNGLKESNGEYIVFLDADDCLLPDALVLLVAFLEKNPTFAFVSGRVELIDSYGIPTARPTDQNVEGDLYKRLLSGNYIWSPGAVMYRASVFETQPAFDPALRRSADFEINLRIARTLPVGAIEDVILQYRQHDTNMTNNSISTLEGEMKVRLAEYKYITGNADFIQAWINGNKSVYQYFGEKILKKMRAGKISKAQLFAELCYLTKSSPYAVLKTLWRGVIQVLRFKRGVGSQRP